MSGGPQVKVFLGTVLLESRRWSGGTEMSCRVSEWLGRIAEAGFDGIELWENHAALAEAGERDALRRSRVPMTILNSYASLDDAGAARRQQAVQLVREFASKAVKFNVSKNAATVEQELDTAVAWGAEMPGVQLLCECHGGTPLQYPREAARLLETRPGIGVIVHAFATPDLDDWMRLFGKRVMHVHAQLRDPERGWIRLREKSDVIRERVEMLRRAGFEGSFTIEFTKGVSKAPEDQGALFASACDDRALLLELWHA